MKILIVCQYYYPEQFQINEIAPELVKRGHEVTVLTGLPNYPEGKIYDGYYRAYENEDYINGVRVIRVKEIPRKKGAFNLIINYLSFAYYGYKRVNKIQEKYNVVFCYQLSPVTMLIPAISYAKRFDIPIMTYCLDIWPESAKSHIRVPILFDLICCLSKYLYNQSNHIAVTSRPFVDYFSDVIGYNVKNLSYIPQHANDGMLKERLNTLDNGVVDFLYAGNMGKAQTLEVVIKAVAEIRSNKHFLVHMVGEGSQREYLEKLAKDLGVDDHFVFYGNQPRDKMNYFYQDCDALLLTLRGNNAVGNTMPGKLQMYMTTGKPIFAAINGAAKEIIEESDCGKCVASGDYKGLSEIMLDFINYPEKYTKCGDNAREYFKLNFTLEKYISSIEERMRFLVGEKNGIQKTY